MDSTSVRSQRTGTASAATRTSSRSWAAGSSTQNLETQRDRNKIQVQATSQEDSQQEHDAPLAANATGTSKTPQKEEPLATTRQHKQQQQQPVTTESTPKEQSHDHTHSGKLKTMEHDSSSAEVCFVADGDVTMEEEKEPAATDENANVNANANTTVNTTGTTKSVAPSRGGSNGSSSRNKSSTSSREDKHQHGGHHHHHHHHDSQHFEEGSMVLILRTPDVEQRVAHTIDEIGIIEEIPQHPNTWLKVRLQDSQVLYKYRPSALQLLSSKALAARRNKQNKAKAQDQDLKDQQQSGSAAQHDDSGEDSEQAKEEQEQDLVEYAKRLRLRMRVKVLIPSSCRKDYPDWKNLHGKTGIILERIGPTRFQVELEHGIKKRFKVPLSAEVLRVVKPQSTLQPMAPQQHDESGKPHRHHKGELLSVLDPDMWIDRKCRINVGKFKGQTGRVLRSGNGWVQLKLENSHENTAKRAYELTLLEDMATIKELYKKSLEKAKERRRANGQDEDDEEDDGGVHGGDDDDDDDHDGSKSELDDDHGSASGPEGDKTHDEHTDDSQTEDNGGGFMSHGSKRTRRSSTRGSYGISWIERKVLLPNRKGFGIVKKADRETCTVEIGPSKVLKTFKKKDLELVEGSESNKPRGGNRGSRNSARNRERGLVLPEGATLMGTTATRYLQFQDLIRKFVLRRRERVKKRPNLQEWQARLDLKYVNGKRDERDEDVVDLVVIPQCEICGMEQEDINGLCWNMSCPKCAAFDVESFDPNDEEAFARFPIVPFANDCVTSTVCQEAATPRSANKKRKRRQF